MMALIVVSLVLGFGGVVTYILTQNIFWGLAFWIITFGSFFLQGLRKIPAQPPHKGILTVWGKRREVIKDEGWNFFSLYPWWHGVILINVTKVNQDLPAQIVRTPDLAELTIPVSITWTPNKESPASLIEFLNSGGEAGVKTILEDIIRERLREWAISIEEGPQNWQDAMAAREEAAAVLLKAILGEELKQIPSTIPTPILLKYFNNKKPNEGEARRWGPNWEKVKEEINKLSEEEREKIKIAVKQRQAEIVRARQGNGHFKKSQLGIIINRLNIGEIKPKGKLAEAAESRVKEEQERRGEVFEVETDLLKAQQLVEAAKKEGGDLSLQQAFQIIMEWKATREGRGFALPGLSSAITEILGGIKKISERG